MFYITLFAFYSKGRMVKFAYGLVFLIFLAGCSLQNYSDVEYEALVTSPDVFLDEPVHVLARAVYDDPVCTMRTCPVNNPCCNECISRVHLESNFSKIKLPTDLMCQGSGCFLNCTVSPGNHYFSGRLALGNLNYFVFKVDSYN